MGHQAPGMHVCSLLSEKESSFKFPCIKKGTPTIEATSWIFTLSKLVSWTRQIIHPRMLKKIPEMMEEPSLKFLGELVKCQKTGEEHFHYSKRASGGLRNHRLVAAAPDGTLEHTISNTSGMEPGTSTCFSTKTPPCKPKSISFRNKHARDLNRCNVWSKSPMENHSPMDLRPVYTTAPKACILYMLLRHTVRRFSVSPGAPSLPTKTYLQVTDNANGYVAYQWPG